ncbi:MAG: hypothetical protein ABI162_04060 [Luteolibacter sp.]
MKKILIFVLPIILIVSSCTSSDRDLGDKFFLFKGYPLSIGLNVGGGGVQGLLEGDIVAFGYDDKYITVRMRSGEYFYLEKSKILMDPAEPTNRGKGPFSSDQFNEMTKTKRLPTLSYKP